MSHQETTVESHPLLEMPHTLHNSMHTWLDIHVHVRVDLGQIYMYNIDTRACVIASHPHFANNWKRVSCSQTAQTASQALPYMHMQKDAREVRRDVEEISHESG